MSHKDIQFDFLEEIIVPAIDLFYRKQIDKDLLLRNSSERTIVANIYCKANRILQIKQKATRELSKLDIDIEYDRNDVDQKWVYEKCGACSKKDCFINIRKPKITVSSPDMIIHQRGSNEDNQVVIEFKKVGNTKKTDRLADKTKLIYFTCNQPFSIHEEKDYKYHIGFFIDLDIDKYSVTTYQDATFDDPHVRIRDSWVDF
jgi:hypothetical protein